MSWYGTHPVISREEAAAVLPKGLCSRCVYHFRCFGTLPRYYKSHAVVGGQVEVGYGPCPRCGYDVSKQGGPTLTIIPSVP